jgi:hypothetical protein
MLSKTVSRITTFTPFTKSILIAETSFDIRLHIHLILKNATTDFFQNTGSLVKVLEPNGWRRRLEEVEEGV